MSADCNTLKELEICCVESRKRVGKMRQMTAEGACSRMNEHYRSLYAEGACQLCEACIFCLPLKSMRCLLATVSGTLELKIALNVKKSCCCSKANGRSMANEVLGITILFDPKQ